MVLYVPATLKTTDSAPAFVWYVEFFASITPRILNTSTGSMVDHSSQGLLAVLVWTGQNLRLLRILLLLLFSIA
jgi:hypothetical protein